MSGLSVSKETRTGKEESRDYCHTEYRLLQDIRLEHQLVSASEKSPGDLLTQIYKHRQAAE